MNETITCASYLANPLYAFKRKKGEESISNGLVLIGTSAGLVQVRRAHDYAVVRTIRTRKQLEEQFTRPTAGRNRSPGTSKSSLGRGRATSSSRVGSSTNRVRIAFDDEDDMEDLSDSPRRADRKRGLSDSPMYTGRKNLSPGAGGQGSPAPHGGGGEGQAPVRRSSVVPVTVIGTFRSKMGDWVIVGDIRGTTRIFKLSKGPEIISCYRHARAGNKRGEAGAGEGTDGGGGSSGQDHIPSVTSLAFWERDFPCLYVGYADGLVGQFNVTTGTWMRGMELPVYDPACGPGPQPGDVSSAPRAAVKVTKQAVKMLTVLPQWKVLLGTTFVDKYLMFWDLSHHSSVAIDMTANLPRNSSTFNNSSMATSTFIDPGGKFLFVGFDDGGFTVNSMHFDADRRELTIIPVRLFATIGARLKKGPNSKKLPDWIKRNNSVQWLTAIKFDRFTDTLLTGDVCGVARMVHSATGETAVEGAKGSSHFETRGDSFDEDQDPFSIQGEEEDGDEEIEIDLDLDMDFELGDSNRDM
jgi:hypothetical protein